jgi:hypothetical protein
MRRRFGKKNRKIYIFHYIFSEYIIIWEIGRTRKRCRLKVCSVWLPVTAPCKSVSPFHAVNNFFRSSLMGLLVCALSTENHSARYIQHILVAPNEKQNDAAQPLWIWQPRGSWPNIYYTLAVAVLFLWDALSDERTGLSFVYVAGSRQCSLSLVRVPGYRCLAIIVYSGSAIPTFRRHVTILLNSSMFIL